ncbi:MAG: hypothetical protein ACRD3O_18350 [Terriglobia bacterium]
MSGNSKIRHLRYRVKGCVWFAAISAVHRIFDSKIGKRTPLRDFKVLALCVYRHKNAPILFPKVSEAVERGWEVSLWALDTVHGDLERYSRGAGAGSRCALLNSLIAGRDLAEFDWIIVMDDDFEFQRGSLASFLAAAQEAQVSLAQPAHVFRGHRAFRINCAHPLSVARLTTFVEIGPIFAVNRVWARKILPFPDDYGMGYGLDILWSDLRHEGARLGVIDWITIKHLGPLASDYAYAPEQNRVLRTLQDRGLQSVEDMQKTLDSWRPWQRRPPWL